MAQSPESAETSADSAYAKSWDALGALIAQGKSFSGRERNCAFLNLGAKDVSFACASGAVNLDQRDDSRAIIPVDWDGDGDLDLWYANRTAPRLRFLRNDVVSGAHWLALQLEGRTCNRDAIGARAELTLTTADGTKRTLWRRVKAGDGFLSQTPKTLHFGFRGDEKVERLVIRWPMPGLAEQVVTGIANDHRWKITEGSAAQPVGVKPLTIAAGAVTLPEEKDEVRAVLVNRPPVPKLEYLNLQGRVQSLEGTQPQPVLVLFWGSWCPFCAAEMKELTAHAAELNGLHILALAVDTAKPDPDKSAIEDVRRALSGRGWTFDAGFATQATVRTLALLEARALYPEHNLPLPSAYLLSPAGALSIIYHGATEPAQLAKDAAFAAQPPADMEAAAFPFPGRPARSLFPLSPAGLVQTLREAGYVDAARAELQRQLSGAADAAGQSAIWRRLADLEEEAARPAEALAAWERALALTPADPLLPLAQGATLWKAGRRAEADAAIQKAQSLAKDTSAFQNQLGKVWQTLGEHGKAREAFTASLAASPDNAEVVFNLAVSRQFTGDIVGAIAGYEAVLKARPDFIDAASNLVWLLATAKDASQRNPPRAAALAGQIIKSTRGQSPAVLDNLAAAQAAGGDFPTAVETAGQALALALATGEHMLAADISKHLATYRERKAWRE